MVQGLGIHLRSVVLCGLVWTSTARATWSIVIADRETKEVAVGTVTCLTDFDLLSIVPVVVVGKGAAAVQAAGDFDGIRRPIIFDNLIAGIPPENILAIVAGVTNHQDRQYGIVDTMGRNVTFTGSRNSQWAGGVTGNDGTLFYSIQGNILAGGCVVPAIEQAILTTVGDIPAKLMAGMQAAGAHGGDGRCSCSPSIPTSCGCPPAVFTKPGHIGGMIVARIGDGDDPVCNAGGCADGDYFMRLNVPFQSPANPDPVTQLQDLFDAWRAALSGRPDAIRSTVTFDPPGPLPDGASTMMRITPLDWQGTALSVSLQSLTVQHASDSDGISTIGPVVDNGDGSFSVVLSSSTTGAATDRFRITMDDGIRPVILMPEPVLELLGPMPTNDCALAPTVSEGVFPVSTLGATTDGPDEPAVCDFSGDTQVASDTWFCYTPSSSDLVTASLCGSGYNTKIAVYNGCTCPAASSAAFCNDDACGFQSEVTFSVTAGQSFLLRIGGFAGEQGTGTLTITGLSEACCLPDGTCLRLLPADCLAAGGSSGGSPVCATASCPPPPPQPELILNAQGTLVASAKNRFLSFSAGEAGRQQAVRVTFVDLPGAFGTFDGTTAWVGKPQDVSELGGRADNTPPTFKAAMLQCTPVFMDWTVPGTVHVSHEAIIPGGEYALQVVDSSSAISNESNFSAPLSLATPRWGDCCGPFNTDAALWTAPDGSVEVTADVIALLDKFGSEPGAPIKARVDLVPATLDRIIDIGDIVATLDAFSGSAFPFSPGKPPCS